jgi:hypothetical protein
MGNGKRVVAAKDLDTFAKDNGCNSMEISTKKGTNVDLAIKKISESAVQSVFGADASLGYNAKPEEQAKELPGMEK